MILAPLILFIPPIALFGVAFWAWRRGTNSAREDITVADDTSKITLPVEIDGSLGWPYFFGRGSPATPWSDGPKGVDCSGYAQMVLVKLGKLAKTATDRGSQALADASNPLKVGQQVAGDLAYYPGHVMVVAGEPDDTGHSPVIGASGGTSTTFGTNSNARVKLFDTALYRGDFVTYMRLK